MNNPDVLHRGINDEDRFLFKSAFFFQMFIAFECSHSGMMFEEELPTNMKGKNHGLNLIYQNEYGWL
jgi:hypothetical protein